ncbi:MAG: SPOR domain-containing protein [Thermodesulfobacteriota bacterium]|nr:SPOR domain-containing protein [Thermodesulfobacteriota bacterium]
MARDIKKKKAPRDQEGPRRYTLRFSLPGLISLCLLLVTALSWMFVMGVLVGRGYKPENAVPQIVKVLPKAHKPNATAVLKPEELEFYDELKKKPKAAPKQKAEVQEPPAQAHKPPKELSFAGVPPKKAPKEAVYNYTYQAAAFRDLDAAKKFQARLAKLGLSSGLERAVSQGKTWHRVLVYFKGTPTDTRELKEKLKTLGVKKALLKEKKPLSK